MSATDGCSGTETSLAFSEATATDVNESIATTTCVVLPTMLMNGSKEVNPGRQTVFAASGGLSAQSWNAVLLRICTRQAKKNVLNEMVTHGAVVLTKEDWIDEAERLGSSPCHPGIIL